MPREKPLDAGILEVPVMINGWAEQTQLSMVELQVNTSRSKVEGQLVLCDLQLQSLRHWLKFAGEPQANQNFAIRVLRNSIA